MQAEMGAAKAREDQLVGEVKLVDRWTAVSGCCHVLWPSMVSCTPSGQTLLNTTFTVLISNMAGTSYEHS